MIQELPGMYRGPAEIVRKRGSPTCKSLEATSTSQKVILL